MVVCARVVHVDPRTSDAPAWPMEVGLGDPAEPLVAEWEEIYISQTEGGFPACGPTATAAGQAPGGGEALPVVPKWVVGKLARAGFALAAPALSPEGTVNTAAHTSPAAGDGECTVRVEWERRGAGAGARRARFTVHLAAVRRGPGYEIRYENVRASVQFGGGGYSLSPVSDWDDGTRTFGDDTLKMVRLTFSPGATEDVKVLDIDVGGTAYDLPALVHP